MERWQEQLSKHRIISVIDQLNRMKSIDFVINDALTASEYARIIKISEKLTEVVDTLDPDLAPLDVLSNIYVTLQNNGALETISQILSSKDSSRFSELSNQLTSVLSYISQLRGAFSKKASSKADYKASSLVLEKFSKSIQQREDSHKDELNRFKQSLANLSDLSKKYEMALSDSSAQLEKTLLEISNSFNETKSQNNISFNETLSEIRKNSETQFNEFHDEINDNADNFLKETSIYLEEIKNQSSDKLEEIKKFYGLVAKVSVSGGHKKIADHEGMLAEIWRGAAVLAIIATMIWLFYVYFKVKLEFNPDKVVEFWFSVGKTISISAILVSFAVYASRQSSLHRIGARKAQEFFLQVQAFDPFVESLSAEDRSSLKKELTGRIFKPDEGQHDKTILELGDYKAVEKFIDLMADAVKAIGAK